MVLMVVSFGRYIHVVIAAYSYWETRGGHRGDCLKLQKKASVDEMIYPAPILKTYANYRLEGRRGLYGVVALEIT